MTRKRLSVGEIRSAERESASRFRGHRVSLPNPTASPVIDKSGPQSPDDNARALGVNPNGPKSLIDLVPGDAGAGQTSYRRIHAFFNLGQPAEGRISQSNYVKALPIITMRDADQKPKYWHFSVYGFGVRRVQTGAPVSPLNQSTILSSQFTAIALATGGAGDVPITPAFVPSVNTSQVRVLVHDESGGRYFDADVIGNRSFSVYGWGVTAFLLVKEGGYEVDAQNPDANPTLATNTFGTEDDLVGARVLGIYTNKTNNVQNRTISVTMDTVAETRPRIIPIPPGARTVQIFTTDANPPVNFLVQFWYGEMHSGVRADMGRIDFSPAQSNTAVIAIPNVPSIFIQQQVGGLPQTNWSLIFEVEA